MKTFSDLLATELKLEVVINGQVTIADLHDNLKFQAGDAVVVDGVEILPRYHYLAQDGVLSINGPFYGWLHRATSQGWLLEPYLTTTK